ncbi:MULTISPECIES: Holliday junction branch migration protein RuvA [Rhizobium]|uniref:Holliday junction branch migration complex subunit RuvA n=1 Tax=Rhizobium rhododendri TaxID=2506430 RepID=A0ABY8IDW7_9HYPH|nr:MULTISPECIES: Holliday junction branch migration protein RuvA [Rhizobium]MBO9099368.1 Holliday junction branch migration protein RuvA [Rhizobium sp. L58/93]MBO9131826.1 Holliday junction branch migration protein RuvA [Rhizobium sp. B209b/85]MBO9169632.1 Holliday junction branch migration protein RuvA [Rhizobium sp. L245/93]MBO9185581.1 Holliday junction branch migration protein RuvA [Rhizobium sp. E27B/91]MBZ5759008.1 Holliday junction branch migration protein RuvA [Rhizobium sp. VS19-DR96]
MIGKLKGTIEEIGEDYALVDVHGVCYVAYCSSRTLARLGGVGEACVLFIETYVREDQLKLFGFLTVLEREWFILLQSVQGVGAKVALAVLSTLTTSELANAIALQDKTVISRAPGVGPKVAMRMVLELKNKAPAFAGEALNMGLKQEIGEGVAAAPVSDAVSALTNLGYSRDQAANAVAAAMKTAGEGADSAKLIRLGLRELSK